MPAPWRRSDGAAAAKYRGTGFRGAGNRGHRQSLASTRTWSPHIWTETRQSPAHDGPTPRRAGSGRPCQRPARSRPGHGRPRRAAPRQQCTFLRHFNARSPRPALLTEGCVRYDSTMSERHPHRAISSAAKAWMLALSGMASAASTMGATTGAVASGSVAPTAPVTPAAVAPTGPVAPMTGPRIIEVLDQTIDWYRTLGVQQQAANEPRDLLILFDNRQTANQVIGLAFDIARADAEILAKQPPPKNTDAGGSPQTQTLAQLQDKFTAQGVAAQQELDSNQHQLA